MIINFNVFIICRTQCYKELKIKQLYSIYVVDSYLQKERDGSTRKCE